MSTGIDKAENDADKFASTVLHCSHNAEKYLKIRDYHKASEMMRSAVSCVIKAVAAKQNKQLKSHNRVLADYAREFAKKQDDKEMLDSFSKASQLHSNFYESNLEPKTIIAIMQDVSKTIGRLVHKTGYRAP